LGKNSHKNLNYFYYIIRKKKKLNMRHKIPDYMKKDKTAVSIDDNLLDIFNEYLKENNISNKSKYIESLIRKDMEQRGKNIDRKF